MSKLPCSGVPLVPRSGLCALLILAGPLAFGFEGRIVATLTRGGEAQSLFYTAGTNQLRIECGESDRPYAKNIFNRDTGELTLLFPHNRGLVRLKSTAESTSATAPSVPAMPVLPPGVGPRTQPPSAPPAPARIGPTNLPDVLAPVAGLPPGIGPQAGGVGDGTLPTAPGAGAFPMPMMPPMMMEKVELIATGEKTNLLGYACEKFEIKQRGEVMEIWATDKLLPFQPWLQNQPHRFGPRMIEEHWGDLLKAKKLFPLRAVLKFENGPERLRFEVQSVTPLKIEDKDGALFQPPADYHEVEPLPF